MSLTTSYDREHLSHLIYVSCQALVNLIQSKRSLVGDEIKLKSIVCQSTGSERGSPLKL